MRVSIVGPAYPLRGGIAHHVYWLQQQLATRGHTVQVISFRKLYPSLLFPGTTERDESRLTLNAEARAILVPYQPLTWINACKAVKAFAPQLVVFQWWQPFFAPLVGVMARFLKRAGLHCVIECHNVFPHEGTPLDRMLLKFAFLPFASFITHSTTDRRDLQTLVSGKQVSVSALPFVKEFHRPTGSPRNGRTILFFGKVRKYKGLGVLLAAMPNVLAEVDCTLLIVGEFYDSLDKYKQLIRDLGVDNHVSIENRYVPNEEVPDIFARADVLVLPYLSATQSAVAQIALSNGLPIIASTAGGLSETVKENVNGLLFPPQDSARLAEQIITYFKNGLGPVFANNLQSSPSDNTNCKIIEILEQAGNRNSKSRHNSPEYANPTET
jgi:glycosyltransferase involved in cell wall biosynthesis